MVLQMVPMHRVSKPNMELCKPIIENSGLRLPVMGRGGVRDLSSISLRRQLTKAEKVSIRGIHEW